MESWRGNGSMAALVLLAVAAIMACGTVLQTAAKPSASPSKASPTAGHAAPPPRDFPAMAYDKATSQVVLFGGAGQTDTWTWSGSGWTEEHPAHSLVVADIEVAAYDPISKRILLVETPTPGVNGGVSTWSWSGGDWHLLATAHQPIASFHASLVLNRTAGTLVLISNSPQSWAWDGKDWRPDPTPPAPGDVVFDTALGTLVDIELGGQGYGPIVSRLVPGTGGGASLWEQYGQATGAWPDYPIGYSLYHEALGKVVYLMPARDGGFGNETWTWSNGAWALWPSGAEPSGFWRSHAVYDDALHAIVFFGGGVSNAPTNETWLLTTHGWTQAG